MKKNYIVEKQSGMAGKGMYRIRLILVVLGIAICGQALADSPYKRKFDNKPEPPPKAKQKRFDKVEPAISEPDSRKQGKEAVKIRKIVSAKPISSTYYDETAKNKLPVYPLTQKVIDQVSDFYTKYNKIEDDEKQGEFESTKEFNDRVYEKSRKFLYTFSDRMSGQVFSFNFITPSGTKLKYDRDYEQLGGDMTDLLSTIKLPHLSQSQLTSQYKFYFQGIEKLFDGKWRFKCSGSEARKVKKALKDSWDYDMQIWLKLERFSYCVQWNIVRVYFIPKEKN